ncbi:hypothetical protein CP967_14500 [Streptomyces nitrosporeus]|uniref:Uncharacterized protein n=2 Tax=Streptomyces nitrosporeus TaxID=28894 RepID=A0A5J6F9P1_9ACTN|nr:hypothetical protein CP967_14500 [Streptomyces nitrosporeus]
MGATSDPAAGGAVAEPVRLRETARRTGIETATNPRLRLAREAGSAPTPAAAPSTRSRAEGRQP